MTTRQIRKYDFLTGKRVRLIFMNDIHTSLRTGDEGTVKYVDAINNIHVDWDNGSGLALIPGVDLWEEIE
ncbi:MAG: DUF4314 domain-containing protein [Bacteroidetes bacterium]|nr:DUF4314 domain-containing protein [Bacteroidota bacterium]